MNKNILFSNSIKTTGWGGGEKWTLTAAKALTENGMNVYIICRKNSVLEQKAQNAGIPTLNTAYTNSMDCFSVLKIYQIIKTYHINAIICSTTLDIKLAGLAGKLAHIPIISRQGLALIPNSLTGKILVKYFTKSIITNTISIKKQYEQYKWFPRNHIKVIYNGVAIEQQPQKTEKQTIQQQYDIPNGTKLILSSGRLTYQKGFSFLIDAANQAQKNNKNWYFLILGSGYQQQELQTQIDRYHLKNIRLQGFCENVHDYYSISDLFVLSSLSEGTPNVILEAMANGIPVVATNVNGVNEIIKNRENGIIVPAKNAKALYEAIQYIIDTPQMLTTIGTKGYQTVSNQFTIAKFSKEFSEYINEILSDYEKNHHKNS